MKKTLPIISAIFIILPFLCLMAFGFYWLFERHIWFYFLPSLLLSFLIGYLLLKHATRKNLKSFSEFQPAIPEWSIEKDESAWEIVKSYQEKIAQKVYDPERPDDYLKIARNLLRELSSYYNPCKEAPELEVSIPHLLHALSKTIDDLNTQIKRIPASHLITINSIRKTHKNYKTIMKYYEWAQFFYLFLSPKTFIFQWLRNNMTKLLKENISSWFMGNFVFFFGQRIIELYGGKILLTEDVLDTIPETAKSQRAVEKSEEFAEKIKEQPISIIVCGQVNSGKSSLINVIFGEMKSAADSLPATDGIVPFILDDPDVENRLIIYDTPGYEQIGEKHLSSVLRQTRDVDIIILCCFATNAAREADRKFLESLQKYIEKSGKVMPAILLVTPGIDLLRPVNEWNPPFNLDKPKNLKEKSISGMIDVVKKELGNSIWSVIPLCLLDEKLYNVSETLIPTIYSLLPEAKRVLLVRVMKDIKRSENLKLLFKQAMDSGKLVIDLLDKLL